MVENDVEDIKVCEDLVQIKKDKAKLRSKLYYDKHKNEILEKNRVKKQEYYKKNCEKIKERSKLFYEKLRENQLNKKIELDETISEINCLNEKTPRKKTAEILKDNEQQYDECNYNDIYLINNNEDFELDIDKLLDEISDAAYFKQIS